MKHSANIYNELKEVTPFLAEMEKTNVFSVPEKYFEMLTEQILQKAAEPLFYALPTSEPHFSGVPEGYFDTLPGNILAKIKRLESDDPREELREISPMLYAVQNENVFTVPKGYFENLPGLILTMMLPQTKVATMKRRSVFWKYALAAMLTGMVAVSALWITNKSSQQTAVITETKTIPSFVKDAIHYKNEQQIAQEISNLDDDDIINYLEITGNNADDDLLATSIYEKDLPAEQDYLLDDKTLDTYLSKIDLKHNEN